MDSNQQYSYKNVVIEIHKQKTVKSPKFVCSFPGIIAYVSDENNYQKFSSFILMIIELFKIALACMLSVFVPQSCNGKLCTPEDNFRDLTTFNVVVLAYNFVTLAIFILAYVYEMKREYWIIKNFDIDGSQSDDNLKLAIKKYPDVEKNLSNINKRYFYLYALLYIFVLTNFIISGVLIFRDYYYNYTTATSMITYFLLVINKVHSHFAMAKKCKNENRAISAYIMTLIQFNIMDKITYAEKKVEVTRVEAIIPMVVEKNNSPHDDNDNEQVAIPTII